MTISDAVTQYVAHKRALGMRFNSEERALKSFCCYVRHIPLVKIEPAQVRAFLDGAGPVTSFWHRKYGALNGFYRYAIARGHVNESPLPKIVPKLPPAFVPYIFTRDELRRLLQATETRQNSRCLLQAETFRTLLLLLYGAALRISEALSLTLNDVDLENALVCVRESKFYRTRWVPVGADLCIILARHVQLRRMGLRDRNRLGSNAPLFITRTGAALTRQAAEVAFCRLRAHAGVVRSDGARYQPRLHDMRHAAAVHRVIDWYRRGYDVQRLLPLLATYLGHVHICGTQRYLTLTSELLREAGRRFERYAVGERHE
jgi:site-specific recombinase XerD